MLIAIENGKRKFPSPGASATCPACGTSVIAKCGNVNAWHWAHQSLFACDTWSESETEWHASWKKCFSNFGDQYIEKVFHRNGKVHRTDAWIPDGTCFEFQHSPISVQEIKERQAFYGKVVWVFDAREAYRKKRITFRSKDGWKSFRWKHAWKSTAAASCPFYLDIGEHLNMGERVFCVRKVYTDGGYRGWGTMLSLKEQQSIFLAPVIYEIKRTIQEL